MATNPTILAGLILELFEQHEASPKDQIEALELVREIVAEPNTLIEEEVY